MPPASAVNNNSNNAAVQAAAKAEREEKLRGALKTFILKERQRKKEEYEAQCEEIRLRKEREALARANDMALAETRAEMSKMEGMLDELNNRKQELFAQLKKVFNEDDTRKKQHEAYAATQQSNAAPTQIFATPPGTSAVGRLQQQLPLLAKQPAGPSLKRGRTPSPPPSHQTVYKEHDDGRRSADYARVLWSKQPTQYATTGGGGTLYYQTSSGTQAQPQAQPDVRLSYPYSLPHRPNYAAAEVATNGSATPLKSESESPAPKPTAQIYHINFEQPPNAKSETTILTTATKTPIKLDKLNVNERYQLELKPEVTVAESLLYKPAANDTAVALHAVNIMHAANNTNAAQLNKPTTGSITQGYAGGRITPQEQQQQTQRLTPLSSTPSSQPPTQPTQQPSSQFSRRIF